MYEISLPMLLSVLYAEDVDSFFHTLGWASAIWSPLSIILQAALVLSCRFCLILFVSTPYSWCKLLQVWYYRVFRWFYFSYHAYCYSLTINYLIFPIVFWTLRIRLFHFLFVSFMPIDSIAHWYVCSYLNWVSLA